MSWQPPAGAPPYGAPQQMHPSPPAVAPGQYQPAPAQPQGFPPQAPAQPQGTPAGYAPGYAPGYPQQPPQGYPQQAQPQQAQPQQAQPQAPAPQPPAMAPGQGALAAMFAQMRSAPDPANYGQGFDHPQGAPWAPGQPGAFDGEYRLRLTSVDARAVDKGTILSFVFDVLGGSGQATGTREIACFMWSAPHRSDAKGHTQALFNAVHGPDAGPYTDAFAGVLVGPSCPAIGREFDLIVMTRPQRAKAHLPFTKKVLTPVQAVQAPTGPALPAGLPQAHVPAPFNGGAQ